MKTILFEHDEAAFAPLRDRLCLPRDVRLSPDNAWVTSPAATCQGGQVVTNVVCLGLGSPMSSPHALQQLAFLELLRYSPIRVPVPHPSDPTQ